MNGRIKRHASFVEGLCDSDISDDGWRAVIRLATPVQIGFIIECVYNLVENRLPVTAKERQALLPHAQLLKSLSQLREAEKARRALLIHGEKFLPSLVGAVLALSGGSPSCSMR